MKKLIVIVILGLLLTGCADIHAYDAQLAEKDATIAKLQSEIASKDAEIAARDAQIANLKAEYDKLKAEKEPKPLKNFVSLGDLYKFLGEDDTDTFPFTPDFDCDNFAYRLHENAAKRGYLVGLFYIKKSPISHLMNFAIIETGFSGIYSIEPQTDEVKYIGEID